LRYRYLSTNFSKNLLYDQAIQSALQNGFTQNAAIAAECAGRFYLDLGDDERARKYLLQAKGLFGEWGAVAKVRQMEGDYSLLCGVGG
jgi:hypothetical protein